MKYLFVGGVADGKCLAVPSNATAFDVCEDLPPVANYSDKQLKEALTENLRR